MGGVEAPTAVFAAGFAATGVADELGQREVVDELRVPIEPEQAADGCLASAAGGTDGEEGAFFAAGKPVFPGGVGLANERGYLDVDVGRRGPGPEAAGDAGVAEKEAVGDGGEAPGAEEAGGPGAEEAGVSGSGGMGGVELRDGGLVAGEEVAGAEVGEAERLDVVIAGEENAAVGMVIGELGKFFRDGAEGRFTAPLRIDRIGVIAEEAEHGAFACG